MTRDEGFRLLNLKPGASRREIDQRFADARQLYTRKLRFSTSPAARDDATKALALLQEAYRVLAGGSPQTNRSKPTRSANTKTQPAAAPGARCWSFAGAWQQVKAQFWPRMKVPFCKEYILAVAICAVLVVLTSVLLLATTIRTP